MNDKKFVIKPKHPKGEDGYKVISIRIRDETVEGLDKIASQTGHSRNYLIGIFLAYALKHCVVEDGEG